MNAAATAGSAWKPSGRHFLRLEGPQHFIRRAEASVRHGAVAGRCLPHVAVGLGQRVGAGIFEVQVRPIGATDAQQVQLPLGLGPPAIGGDARVGFDRRGAEAAAREGGIPFLGRVPLDIAIRTASDTGQPPAALEGDKVFAPIAAQVADWLAAH